MDLSELIAAFLAAACIPSAVTGLCVWMLQRKISKRDDARDQAMEKREKDRREYQALTMDSMRAVTVLAESCAHALQRGKTNGDMEKALEYTGAAQKKHKDFLIKHGIDSIFDD